jgi:hypothetical protein
MNYKTGESLGLFDGLTSGEFKEMLTEAGFKVSDTDGPGYIKYIDESSEDEEE